MFYGSLKIPGYVNLELGTLVNSCRLRRENFQSKSLAESMADSGLRAALMETIGGLMATDQVVLDPAKIRFILATLCRGD